MNRFSTDYLSSAVAPTRSRPGRARWWLGGVLILVVLAWGVWADNIGYPVKIRTGFSDTDAGRLGITRAKLVGTDHLILVLDTDTHAIRLQQVDGNTNLVTTLATSTAAAFLTNGEFAGVMAFSELVIANLGDNTAAVAIVKGFTSTTDTNGNAEVSAHLVGVLNDSTLGVTNEPDRIFQIDLQPTGSGFPADPFGL